MGNEAKEGNCHRVNVNRKRDRIMRKGCDTKENTQKGKQEDRKKILREKARKEKNSYWIKLELKERKKEIKKLKKEKKRNKNRNRES